MDTVLVAVRDAAGRRVAGYAKIDPGSDWLRAYPWHRLTDDGEAVTFAYPPAAGRPVAMAALVLGLAEGEGDAVVRHRNGDPLDNRRANLEATGVERPDAEEGPRRSRYRRVLWDPGVGRWAAYGDAGGRYVDLGRFDDELAAARAARAWALEHQSVHLEDDHRAGGYGRASRAPDGGSSGGRRAA
jgi:hypothetical protein